jgi:hypothetical protein
VDVPLLFVRKEYTFKVAGCLPDMLQGTPSSCHTIALVGHANAGSMCTGSGRATGLDLDTLSKLEDLLCIITLRNVGAVAELLKSKLTATANGYRHVFLLGCSSSNEYDVEGSQYRNQSLADRLAQLLRPAIVYGFDDEVTQLQQLHPLTHLDPISAQAAVIVGDGRRHELKFQCSKSDHKRDFLKKKAKTPEVAMDFFKYT